MKAAELKNGQSYKIGEGTYTYSGLLNRRKGMTRANKLIFWVREDDENSPVVDDFAIRVDTFNNEIAKDIKEV